MKEPPKKFSKRPPGRPPTPDLVERKMIGTRVAPEVYEQLAAAARNNRLTLSEEVARRLEKSLEPTPASSFDQAYGSLVIGAFNMGGRLAAGPERPREEWIKDPAVCERAAGLAIQALLSWLPKPLCDLHDTAGNPIRILSARIGLSANPADAGKLHFITPDENKSED
jgi:hypothetical protein